jgi:predicted dehydrogenase
VDINKGKGMVNVGVIGLGYWGPNILRNFKTLEGVNVTAVYDKNPEVYKRVSSLVSNCRIESTVERLVTSTDVDAVAIVTPVSTHFNLAKLALENGKHVFVEKPLTLKSSQAEELIQIAEAKKLKLMVDHTFIFTGAVRKLKQIIEDGEVGSIYYYDSIRVNLGLFQHDVNVIWDLAPHDFSIMSYLIKEKPVAISAWGSSHVNIREDIAYITVHYDKNIIAHISVNWLSPVKVRTTLIGGEKKMLVWNDLNADEKIKIYDKGVEVKNTQGIYDLLINYRTGDMWAPKVDQVEALKHECNHFIECIENDTQLINNGVNGLNVVRMLEACDQSLCNDGRPVELKTIDKNVQITSI